MLSYFLLATLFLAATHARFALALRSWPGEPSSREPSPRGELSWRWRRLGAGLLVANVLVVPGSLVLTLRAPAAWAWWAVPLARAAFTDVGLCAVLFAGLLASDLGWGLGWLGRRGWRGSRPDEAARRRLLRRGLDLAIAVAASGATAVGYGLAMAPPELRRQRVPVDPARVPPGWSGLRVVQLSDLHVGPTLRRDYVARLVTDINALEADLIVITGDLVDGFVGQLREQVQPLADLRSRHGVFFVTGNHEYFYRADEWVSLLRSLGLRVLANEHALLEHEGATVVVAGLDDPAAPASNPSRPDCLRMACASAPAAALRVLLAHRPGDAAAAAAHGFDLQLSGHIHAGQFFPLTWLVAATEPHVAGLYRVGPTWLYVNRGAGHWGPPNRLGARQEVTLLELHRA